MVAHGGVVLDGDVWPDSVVTETLPWWILSTPPRAVLTWLVRRAAPQQAALLGSKGRGGPTTNYRSGGGCCCALGLPQPALGSGRSELEWLGGRRMAAVLGVVVGVVAKVGA